MSTTYGDSSWTITIADKIKLESTIYVPDGNKIYLCTPHLGGLQRFLAKITDGAANLNIGVQDGSNSMVWTIDESYVRIESGKTLSESFENILEQFRKWHDAGDSCVYLFVYDDVDSRYVRIGYESGAKTTYVPVLVQQFKPDIEGRLYMFKELSVKRVTAT